MKDEEKENLKEITREVLKERKLSFVEDTFKDPIKARNFGYSVALIAFLAFFLAAMVMGNWIEINKTNNEIVKENLILIKNNKILTDTFNLSKDWNNEKRELIGSLLNDLSCEKLKEKLLDPKFSDYDWTIQYKVIATCP